MHSVVLVIILHDSHVCFTSLICLVTFTFGLDTYTIAISFFGFGLMLSEPFFLLLPWGVRSRRMFDMLLAVSVIS